MNQALLRLSAGETTQEGPGSLRLQMSEGEMKITETAFTAVQQWDGSKPVVLTWATASTATAVRKEVGEARGRTFAGTGTCQQ